ncbi:hypothetical protein K2173_017757 [Erythroxylum novogranatense]|uniref:Serine aminopeptidase S33 domain-containing protein n=1 Tax=Erythroxylum novogranatense TaxID=1862640 RepID=A0AAV8T1S0_9ROSI|nr:hypothetical protein K2173_017757 [Erythroxylum novogranatense]
MDLWHKRNWKIKTQFQVRVQRSNGSDSMVSSSDSLVPGEREKNGKFTNGGTGEKVKSRTVFEGENGTSKSRVEEKLIKDAITEELEALWDDGYGTKTIKDCLEGAKELIKPDGGPPRWFCPVECGQPLKDSPLLLFLPGIDGIGFSLSLHHKALGKAFEVRILHIPVYDQTPFEGLVKLVGESVRSVYVSSPTKPIYLVGESFGGCLALAVAACNPDIDLVLVLANPATSFGRSQLQPLFPLLEALPYESYRRRLPYFLGFVLGNLPKIATTGIENKVPLRLQLEQLAGNLTHFLSSLGVLVDIFPKDTLLWKLKLLKSAAGYTNSRLHAVNAEVLVMASGRDRMLPSAEEAKRLKRTLRNCTVRYFKHNGHTLLLEDGVSLLSIIKGTRKYRRSRRIDYVSDFLPPSMSEFRRILDITGLFRCAVGSVVFSILDDGKIVKGLGGVPNEGPVVIVGNHMLVGLEVVSLGEEFLREKNIMIRGLSHPELFTRRVQDLFGDISTVNWLRLTGVVPVNATNFFRLLSTKSYVLLHPGGAREALHFKGEEHKLIWPDEPEFVRMAARFGATIVPFGAVGEDDFLQMVLDGRDMKQIPLVSDFLRELRQSTEKVRDKSKGEVANPETLLPVVLPKLPGRLYYLEEMLQDKEQAKQLYMHIKSQVESNIDYLLQKRKEDPYRNIFDRITYQALNSPIHEIPSFDP